MPLNPNSWRKNTFINMGNFTHNHHKQNELEPKNNLRDWMWTSQQDASSGIDDHRPTQSPSGSYSLSFPIIVILTSIFVFLTVSLTAALIIFCKKRNLIFAVQKCEEEDIDDDYELNSVSVDEAEITDIDDDDGTLSNDSTLSKALVKSKKKQLASDSKDSSSHWSQKPVASEHNGEEDSLLTPKSTLNNNSLQGSHTQISEANHDNQNIRVEYRKILKKQSQICYNHDQLESAVIQKPFRDNVSEIKISSSIALLKNMDGSPRTALLGQPKGRNHMSKSRSYQTISPVSCSLTMIPKSTTMAGIKLKTPDV